MNEVRRAAEQFALTGEVVDIKEHGDGNINDTYLITVDPKLGEPFILQRINTHVFKRPELIVANMRTFTVLPVAAL